MQTLLRQILFIFTTTVLKYPILLLLYLIRPFKPFQYIFLVYPGTDKDIQGYCPLWLAKSSLYRGKPSFAGFISKSKTHARGLVLVVPHTAKDMLEDKDLCEKILHNMEKIATIVGANTIGMAGQAPGIMDKHGIATKDTFMYGTMGTVFSISQTIAASMKKHQFDKGKKVVIVGKSFISNGLETFLHAQGLDAIQIHPHEETSLIKDADIIIALTLTSRRFYPLFPHIKDGAIVIDYTHPKMLKKPKNAHFYKVATSIDGVRFYPRLPGYRSEWIPGCCLESIIHAEFGDAPFKTQDDFNLAATQVGLQPLLVQ